MSAADVAENREPDDLRRSVLNFLPTALLEPGNAFRSILVGWAVAFLPSLLLGAGVSALFPLTAQPAFGLVSANDFLKLVVAAPILETLIMGAILALLLMVMSAPMAIGSSAVGWGIAHSLLAPAWGLVIWWPFLIFSTLFVTWRRHSLAAALAVPACTHALQNLIPAALLFWGS